MKTNDSLTARVLPSVFPSPRNFGRLSLWVMVFIMSACSVLPSPQSPEKTGPEVEDVILHPSFSNDVILHTWSVQEGKTTIYDSSQLGMGLLRVENKNTPPNQLPQNAEFTLDSTGSMQFELILAAAKDSKFLVTALLDYRQVPFYLDGQYGLLHDVSVSSEGDLYIPIQVEINEPGAHDLIVLAFVDPYDRPWDAEARTNSGAIGCRFMGTRTVVVVGGKNEPAMTTVPDVFGSPPPDDVQFGVRMLFADPPGLLFNTSHPSRRQMKMTAYGWPGETFKYQLWMSNYNSPDDTVDYGLMRFLDFHQIDFKGKDLFIAHFDGRQEAIVDDQIVLPSEPGLHELQLVQIFDPYKSILNGQVLERYVFASDCLGIKVR